MLTWQLYEFYGIAPRLRRKQLPKNHATVAHDVDLTHGTLKPFREPLKVSNKTGNVRLHATGCDIFTWDECVTVAEWLPDCPRMFITGRNDYPETMTWEGNDITYRRMGVPRPLTPPTVSAPRKDTEYSREVAYVVTYVNSFGEESAPSLPSEDLVIEDKDPVNILLDYNPPLEYDVKSIRIYRRETGFRTGAEKTQELTTNWFLVDELPIGTGSYIDTVGMMELDYGLSTKDVREPPANLSNITLIEQSALLVGSVGNKLYFSKHLQPHNFPLSDEMTLDDNIVALGSLGNTLFVATDGHPYKLVADMGCDERDCREIVRFQEPMPMIACHTGRGAVMTPFGMMYVSTDGIVLLPDGGPARVITTDVLSADDWRKLSPHTMRLAWHKGALFIVSENITMMYWYDSNTYGDTKHKRLVTLSDAPIDLLQTRQGELLMMTVNGVYQWNAGNKWRPYKWVSEFIDSGFYYDITRIRANVDNHHVTVTVESDRANISRLFPVGDTVIPFSRHGRRKEFQLRVEGTGEVLELAIGVWQIDMATRG